MSPPGLPDTPYTPCYCEENIWMLAEVFSRQEPQRRTWAVFISNARRTVALWEQKLRERVVIWDYHVVLMLEDVDGSWWIYDLDTRLPLPCPLDRYMRETFRNSDVPPEFHSRFRVIPSKQYLDYFASDRSHMLRDNGEYAERPPEYAAIRGRKAESRMNLASFVSMEDGVGYGLGVVVDRV
ncbi:Nt-Gln-amidase domain-containing protein [Mycena kentingensis (nom. inval.)]|nr:Nt-Gln-amidase domain-containing protein [Mycena kentingensis (nom. inval.)]